MTSPTAFPNPVPADWPSYRLGGAHSHVINSDGTVTRVKTRAAPIGAPWRSFNPAEAAAWIEVCYAFRAYPVRPFILAHSLASLRDGGLPTIAGSPQTVRAAKAIGFTPTSLGVLAGSLAQIAPQEYPEHPRNFGGDSAQGVVGQPFDPQQWDGWPALVASGVHPLEATRRHLRERAFTLPVS